MSRPPEPLTSPRTDTKQGLPCIRKNVRMTLGRLRPKGGEIVERPLPGNPTTPSLTPPSAAGGAVPARRGDSGRSRAPTNPVAGFLYSPSGRLITSGVLFFAVAIGGAYFAYRPGPTPLDRLALKVIPSEYTVHYLTYVTDIGRGRFLACGAILCCLVALLWDWRRALACLAAPPAAIFITEYLAKPVVRRMYGGSLSYPSGHMTSVGVLMAVFVIAVPPRWRKSATVFAIAVGLVEAVTLILLRWHYLTDILAGAAVAIATTLLIDTVFHMGPKSWSAQNSQSVP
jgi:membrane-associated phospholipid phosphatase